MRRTTDDLARLLRVLAVGTRLRIVQILQGRALCVGALASRLDVTQGAVSQHLRMMRDAGLVIGEKHGYYVRYRLNERTLDRWRKQIDRLLAPRPVAPCRCSQHSGRSSRDTRSNRKGNQRR